MTQQERVRSVSVVVPTLREVGNLPELLDRLEQVRHDADFDLNVWIMDDHSRDGSVEYVAKRGSNWVKLIERKSNPGLSEAVIDGFEKATGDVIVVMDADLSHPPETIPRLVECLNDGPEFVIGSRFVKGGSIDQSWGIARWLNSRVAKLLALPLAPIADPMSGFFAFRRQLLDKAGDLNPIGFKIGLELLVKARCKLIGEVPIHFADRVAGESKLSAREQLKYIQHLRRLYIFKYGTWSHLAQFIVVGLSGLAVNLLVLTVLLRMEVTVRVALVIAIAVSMGSNFLLNRRFTFSYARDGSVVTQFLGFVTACGLGALVNFGVASFLLARFPGLLPQMAATFGVIAGTAFNFLANRYLVFRKTYLSAGATDEGGPSKSSAPDTGRRTGGETNPAGAEE